MGQYMEDVTDKFKAMGDRTRLKILWLLHTAKGELCVCEIMDSVDDSHSNISRHLKILKLAKLVTEKKHGKWAYFGLTPPKDKFHYNLLEALSSLPKENFSNEYKRLRLRLSLREDEMCIDGLNSQKWIRALSQLEL